MDILPFEIEGRRYGLRFEHVREAVRAVAISPLPGAPSVVEGVIDVRGELVPVMDIRAREGLPARMLDPSESFILAWAGGRLVCFRVDRLLEPAAVTEEAIRSASEVASVADHISGIVALPDGLVLIQDLARFLTPEELHRLGGAMAEVGASL
jgi:purine-binding chemotaxis protein CheW